MLWQRHSRHPQRTAPLTSRRLPPHQADRPAVDGPCGWSKVARQFRVNIVGGRNDGHTPRIHRLDATLTADVVPCVGSDRRGDHFDKWARPTRIPRWRRLRSSLGVTLHEPVCGMVATAATNTLNVSAKCCLVRSAIGMPPFLFICSCGPLVTSVVMQQRCSGCLNRILPVLIAGNNSLVFLSGDTAGLMSPQLG